MIPIDASITDFSTIYKLFEILLLCAEKNNIHHALQTNDFGLRHDRLKKILPFCFVLNKQNYARYGSIYVHNLANIDITHPGCKELLLDKGLSVQAQSRYLLRTSIDQCGEQIIN